MDSQCPGCLGQAVVTLRLPCAIVESPRRYKHVPFVNIAFLHSRSIKRRQWKHKLNYYGVVFAHLATGCGIKAKDPSGLDSDRWIPHSRCCENPARAKALVGFSRHLSRATWIQPLGVFRYKITQLWFLPEALLAYWYCHCLRLCVCVSVCVSTFACPGDNSSPVQARFTEFVPKDAKHFA